MPAVPKESVLAVLVSDIHLSLKRPSSRVEKMEWFDVMAYYLAQLQRASSKFDAPVVCGGDIFDKWDPGAELINFALDHLPCMYAVPGQHDLPAHSYEDMSRSAYGTLMRAGKIIDLCPGVDVRVPESPLVLTGVPWAHEITPPGEILPDDINLAVVHKYIWVKGASFPGAPTKSRAKMFKHDLAPFNAALFGDNHKGFTVLVGDTYVHNNGGFMRRKSDEVDYHPAIGLLMADGSVRRLRLKADIDEFAEREETVDAEFDTSAFISGLKQAGGSDIDFREVVLDHIRKNEVDDMVKHELTEALNEPD